MARRTTLRVIPLAFLALWAAACDPEAAPTGAPSGPGGTLPASQAPATRAPGGASTTLDIPVPATQGGWSSTGIWLNENDSFTIHSDGTLNIWPNCEETKAEAGFLDLDCDRVTQIGPEGTDAFDPAAEGYPLPGGPIGALVARVGSGPGFMVGRGGAFTAGASGLLQLAFNDVADVGDNQGEFKAEVTIPYDMPPSSAMGTWQDTGILLNPGETFTITAFGRVNIWPNCEETKVERGFPNVNCADMTLGPTGTDVFPPAEADYPLPGARVGALVARIGNGPVFLVGEGLDFTAGQGGPLLTAFNDTAYWEQDDRGTFSIVVTRENGEHNIFVPGRLNAWLDTGLQYEAGERARLRAGGTLNLWPRCELEKEGQGLADVDCQQVQTGPAGTAAFDPAPADYPLPGARVGALVGRFGEGPAFLIGQGGPLTAGSAGTLQLRINDIFGMNDNEGGFLAVIAPHE